MRKIIFILFGMMAAVIVVLGGFVYYQNQIGKQFLASAGADVDAQNAQDAQAGQNAAAAGQAAFQDEPGSAVADSYAPSALVDASSLKPQPLPAVPGSTANVKDFGFGGVAEPQKDIFQKMADDENKKKLPPMQTLDSDKVAVSYQTGGMIVDDAQYETFLDEQGQQEPERRVTMIKAPVGSRVIKTQADYTKFQKEKTTWGTYPKVDFSKNSVVILESKGELADYIFQIDSTKLDGKTLTVLYRVNILGLKERGSSHTFAVVNKGFDTVTLQQIL